LHYKQLGFCLMVILVSDSFLPPSPKANLA
jgi:hypothetical protein